MLIHFLCELTAVKIFFPRKPVGFHWEYNTWVRGFWSHGGEKELISASQTEIRWIESSPIKVGDLAIII